MDPETLFTFHFKAPPQYRIVELLGSWDNFTQPYFMTHDRRRGTGTWTGCFRFENIVFDGDSAHWSKPRSGGLKQGGVYWYYYRLDHDVEAFDDSQTCNAHCPLMPGHRMNVIEVPVEILEPPSRARSVCYDGIAGTLRGTRFAGRQTMEPSDKFAALEPPPISRVHGRCISDMALNGRLEGCASSRRESLVSPLGSLSGDASGGLESRPSKRRCSGDRPGSSYSQRSDMSLSRSYRLASVVDAYAAESPAQDQHPDPLRSVPVDKETRASFHRGLAAFDFELAPSSEPHDDKQDEDQKDDDDDLASESAYGPASVRNVQMYGSPFSRPCDIDRDWRPGLYSLPSETLLEHRATKPIESQAAWGAVTETLHRQSESAAEIFGPAISNDGRDRHSSPPEITLRIANADARSGSQIHTSTNGNDEVWSPTFSAATASSSNGVNTPFRLSAAYNGPNAEPQAQELDDITQRLRYLGGTSAHDSPPQRLQEPQQSLSFPAYALPQPAITESVQSLGKLSSRSEGNVAYGLGGPALHVMLRPSEGSSMVEDIFSELGWIGGSIT